jgi:uncharacterized protein DUF4288
VPKQTQEKEDAMSLWYTAHLLMYVKRKNRSVGKIPVWENLVLIKADSEAEAFVKAERRGKQDEGDDDGTFRWAGQPAAWVFAGVRKLTLCEDAEKRPGDGDEISYLEMEVESERSIRDLLAGKPTAVKLTDSTAERQKQNGKAAAKIGA